MTTRERDAIAVLTDHVMELKEDMGEVKADLKTLKETKATARDARHWNRNLGVALMALLISVVGLAHTFIQ